MKRLGWILVGALAVGGCALIAGLDGDYVEGPLGEGGTGLSANGGEAGMTSNSGGSPPGSGGNPTQGGGGTGAGPGNGGGGMGGGGMGGGGSGGGTGCPTGMHTYTAVVAECINPGNPDTAVCETQAGAGETVVSEDSGGQPYDTFFRFDLPSDVALGPFTTATLRLVVGADSNDGGISGGRVWRVDPFDGTSLETTVPANIGATPLSAAVAVAPNQDVMYSLTPTSEVVDGESVYLGVRAFNDGGDDVRYVDVAGASEPRLILVCP